jgi:hypothetical protein
MSVKSKNPCVLPHTKVCGLFGFLDAQDSNRILKDAVFVKNLDITRFLKAIPRKDWKTPESVETIRLITRKFLSCK